MTEGEETGEKRERGEERKLSQRFGSGMSKGARGSGVWVAGPPQGHAEAPDGGSLSETRKQNNKNKKNNPEWPSASKAKRKIWETAKQCVRKGSFLQKKLLYASS